MSDRIKIPRSLACGEQKVWLLVQPTTSLTLSTDHQAAVTLQRRNDYAYTIANMNISQQLRVSAGERVKPLEL